MLWSVHFSCRASSLERICFIWQWNTALYISVTFEIDGTFAVYRNLICVPKIKFYFTMWWTTRDSSHVNCKSECTKLCHKCFPNMVWQFNSQWTLPVIPCENLHKLTQLAGSLAQFSTEASLLYLWEDYMQAFFFFSFSKKQTFFDKSVVYPLGEGVPMFSPVPAMRRHYDTRATFRSSKHTEEIKGEASVTRLRWKQQSHANILHSAYKGHAFRWLYRVRVLLSCLCFVVESRVPYTHLRVSGQRRDIA